MNKKLYLNTGKNLVLADLQVFKQVVVDKTIDVGIWVVLSIFVATYIMPYFGLTESFGPIQFGGVLAAIGLFELYASAVDLVGDFEGDRTINYSLTLPIPSRMALICKSIYYFLVYFTLTVLMLPVGIICLWSQWDPTQIAYGKLLLALVFQSIFYACFVIWASSIIKNMAKLGSIWARCIFPMWYMGGFQFSWLSLHAVLPSLAYLNLLNPMIYITESTRAALLGQEGYINFWLCLLAISLFSCICLAGGMRNLKKRLDFV